MRPVHKRDSHSSVAPFWNSVSSVSPCFPLAHAAFVHPSSHHSLLATAVVHRRRRHGSSRPLTSSLSVQHACGCVPCRGTMWFSRPQCPWRSARTRSGMEVLSPPLVVPTQAPPEPLARRRPRAPSASLATSAELATSTGPSSPPSGLLVRPPPPQLPPARPLSSPPPFKTSCVP